jgi:alpha-L-rhamnosidase
MENFFANTHWVIPPCPNEGCGYGFNKWFVYRSTLQFDGEQAPSAIIAVDSKYWLYVNGERVVSEGGLKRGPVADGTYCEQIDLSAYLHTGENSIALLVWYFGRDGFSHRDSGVPGLLFQAINAELARPWCVRMHPAYFDAGYVHDAYRLSESSIGFDARGDLPGCFDADYDDTLWPLAIKSELAGRGPWGVLELREFPQWYWSEPRDYSVVEKIESCFDDGFVYYRCTLPHNAQFVPILEVDSVAGLAISIHVAQDTSRLWSLYITRSGEQQHEFEGWLNGETVVYRVPSNAVRVIRLQYRETSYPAAFAGHFECDNALLNRLWIKSRRTLLVTMRDNFMDCPCRERAQWPGDLVVQLGQVPYCLDRTADLLVRKGLRETLRWQRPDGVIYGPVPEGNWKCELPAQMLAILSPYGIWTYYMNSADNVTLAELYPYARRYLDIWQFQKSGLIVYRPDGKGTIPVTEDDQSVGVWDWIDWGDNIDAEVCLNAWFVLAAQGLRLMAEALSKPEDAGSFAQKAEQVTQAMRRHFWDDEQGAYISPGFTAGPDDRAQALAVISGVAMPDQYGQITSQLCKVFRACPYMEKYVLEALFKMAAVQQALDRMQSRYRGLTGNNCSTLWERWPEHTSHPGTINHSWSGGPLTLLSQQVAGLAPLKPGWQRFSLKPKPGDLSSIDTKVLSPHGVIHFKACRENGAWAVSLHLPAGIQAEADFSALGSKEGVITISKREWREVYPAGLLASMV